MRRKTKAPFSPKQSAIELHGAPDITDQTHSFREAGIMEEQFRAPLKLPKHQRNNYIVLRGFRRCPQMIPH